MKRQAFCIGIIVCVVGLLMAGCTTLKVDGVPTTSTDTPIGGVFRYSLPLTTMVLTGTAQIDDCPPLAGPDAAFSMTVAGTLLTQVEGDPTHQYTIPYAKMKSFLKETDFSLALSGEKVLTSFNGTINDQAGPLILSSALAGVKIAGAFAVPAVGAAEGPAPPTLCSDAVAAAVKRIKADKADMAKRSAKPAGKSGTPDPGIAADQADVDATAKSAGLIRNFRIQWSPDLANLQAVDAGHAKRIIDHPVDLSAIAETWLDSHYQTWFQDQNNQALPAVQAVRTAVTIRLVVEGWTIGADLPDQTSNDKVGSRSAPAGLVVRDPALATVRLCRGTCSDERDGLIDTSEDLQTPSRIAVSQLGRFEVMPLSNGLFDKSNLTVAAGADGSITSVGTQISNSAAANLATLGQVGDAIATSKASFNTGAVASATYADTVNKALADCLTQQDAIRKAGGKPVPCQ